jgi:hypothetical protein
MKETIIHYLHCTHFTNDMFVVFYPFIMNPINDIYFAGVLISTVLSWYVFRGECILSYIEKKLEDSKYVMGKEIDRSPYHKTFYYHNGMNHALIKDSFWLLTVLILIFYRKNHKYIKYALAFMLLLVAWIKLPILNKQLNNISK